MTSPRRSGPSTPRGVGLGRRTTAAAAGLAAAALLAACSGAGSEPSPGPSSTAQGSPSSSPSPGPSSPGPSTTPTASATATPEPTGSAESPDDVLAGWSLEQKVGQLLMVGVSVSDPAGVSAEAVRDKHVGNVFLHGRSTAGVDATRDLVDGYTALVSRRSTHGTPLLVATDQEGGLVQVLRGPGFSDIPAATEQATWQPGTLEKRARGWGDELAAAGVNLNLAPVMDLVDEADAKDNPPIGYFDRSYGFTPRSVVRSANAFSAGQRAAGVEPVIKHFPGLGRVTANTDTDAEVTDDVTTRDDPSVRVFARGIEAGAGFVMMSTAVYERIDPDAPAAFSPVVVDGLLRDDLGFDGVVMTDDLSAAAQVQGWPPGERAVDAVDAGVDLVLASADPSVAPAMADALVAEARKDPAFATKVDTSARRVLAAKAALAK
ncbi:glycoside hydrolase family 3 N-terminal domain-containing protein [Krasilnikoviella flava]|uniref:beta-N-acetylhexosaminidase n=1 Tax=Krasilnikoviella flava TaxID=526729 RepID=A0A1T5LZW6_9MICO|nr:glycoside hydrolase family 3 N-terminal domain-containing protein [Krasilnikoviella flava]SKC81425.1 beta-N-acetylhexosaminidase [Krasilnikoviella flava]